MVETLIGLTVGNEEGLPRGELAGSDLAWVVSVLLHSGAAIVGVSANGNNAKKSALYTMKCFTNIIYSY